MRSALAAAVALILSGVATADERSVLQLRAWIQAVDRHAAGETDQALNDITAWTHEELASMRPFIELLVEAPVQRNADRSRRRSRIRGDDTAAVRALTMSLQSRGDFDVFRRRAAILHTDAAMLGSTPRVVMPPTPRRLESRQQREWRVDVKSFDGQVTHFELQNPHWELAMDVLDSLPAVPGPDPFIGQWYRSVGAYLARERRFADALRHFARARGVVADDPGVLYGEACLQETLGAPRIQDYARVTTLPNGLLMIGISSPHTHLRRAEALLRKATAADPRLVEGRLRLGRVLSRLERHDDALPHLRAAVTQAPDPATAYYAHLFAGDATQALGRLDEARRHYEEAIAVFPDSQAARLALGSVLRSTGNRAAALAAIEPMLRTPSRGPDDDPWWEYYDGDAAQVDRLLGDLRAPFARPR